ncbi:unnamed protein product [Amoebophrya sp. A120]|nr:unnamed protein product [Amoebophrya sp. A120]|eukprot:GSA120T00015516001.1
MIGHHRRSDFTDVSLAGRKQISYTYSRASEVCTSTACHRRIRIGRPTNGGRAADTVPTRQSSKRDTWEGQCLLSSMSTIGKNAHIKEKQTQPVSDRAAVSTPCTISDP